MRHCRPWLGRQWPKMATWRLVFCCLACAHDGFREHRPFRQVPAIHADGDGDGTYVTFVLDPVCFQQNACIAIPVRAIQKVTRTTSANGDGDGSVLGPDRTSILLPRDLNVPKCEQNVPDYFNSIRFGRWYQLRRAKNLNEIAPPSPQFLRATRLPLIESIQP